MQKIKFAVSKLSLVTIALGLGGIAYADGGAINGGHNFICDKDNLCSAFFEEQTPKVARFCDPSQFSVVWRKGSEKYLFQCRGGGTSEEQDKNWVVDMRRNAFFRVNYGRFYDQDALIANPDIKIPDSFQERPLCHPAIVAKLKVSDFVLLDKRPSEDERSPYCYEPTYLTISGGNLRVQTGKGQLRQGDAGHQVHAASASEKAGLQALLRSLH